MSVNTRLEGRIAFVELDNPPVNAIGRDMRQGLLDAVHWAEAENADRVIVIGAGRAFAAGADAREFDGAPLEPHLSDVLNAIESSTVPWIAAINGVALGGGAEIALACRIRVMSPRAQIGLPEVTLGVIPGAGGTVRLPRLVGLEAALSIISTGKPLNAGRAMELGMIDAIDADPVAESKAFDAEVLAARARVSAMPAPEYADGVVQSAKEQVAKKMLGQIAPLQAIDVIAHGLSAPFEASMAHERRTFLELRQSNQARALRHIFFAERGAKVPSGLDGAPVALDQVAVVGGGTMGAGIAYALLNAGLRVALIEMDDDGVARARQNVEHIIQASLKRGMIDEGAAQDRRDRLISTSDYADASQASLAIEAAFESMDVKKDVFAKLAKYLPSDAVLASNTSYLDLNEIAAGLDDPARVVGLHFFAPAHIMKLLEIVRGDSTSDVALATGFELGKRLRKVPVIAGVCDGFIGNRILARYREAADTVLIDGASPSAIDAAMVEFGYAMGPYEAQDLSGLDIAFANRRRQDATRDPLKRYIPIADRMVEAGRLGKKTGAGWYSYAETGQKSPDAAVEDIVRAEAQIAGVDRIAYSAAEIRERLVFAMINEAADILDEGIAASAADIDLVTVFGYGFPRWRGGLMHYADTLGVVHIVNRLQVLAEEDPVAWRVSPLLLRCAGTGLEIADAHPG